MTYEPACKILVDEFTQEELTNHFNIKSPCKCERHHKLANLRFEDNMFKLYVCCNALVNSVRMQIAEHIANANSVQ